jgi:hypothetical protein
METQTILGLAVVAGAIGLALLALALRMRRLEHAANSQPEPPGPTLAASAPPADQALAHAPAAAETTVQPVAAGAITAHEVSASAETSALAAPAVEMAEAAPVVLSAPAAEGATPPVAQAPAAETPAAPVEAPPAPGEPVEVMRVLRDAKAGSLIVEMGGHRYTRVNDIKDQKWGMSLVDAVIDLQEFIGVDVIAPLAAQQAAERAETVEPEPVQRPSLNPIKQMFILKDRELKKSREKDAMPQPGSIVEEIEAILVERLIGSPFEGRSIHMRPGLHGGAHIDVDGHGYESIEDVADLQVKEFLKSVIAEWEKAR